MNKAVLTVVLLMTSLPAVAIEKSDNLDFFKNMKGSWSIHSDKKELSIKMNYDTGSRDNIVTENFGKELSVISKDGQDTILTHFCNRGHQSRLKLKSSSSKKKFVFEAFDLVNLPSKKDAHVHKIIYKLKSKSVVELNIVWKIENKEKTEIYQLSKL